MFGKRSADISPLILHVEVGCDVAEGSQLGARPAGSLALAGNGGLCPVSASALSTHTVVLLSLHRRVWPPALGHLVSL